MHASQTHPSQTHVVDAFMARVEARNPQEPEFLQAVREVAESVVPYEADHPAYAEARILERMTEPDRILIFRVCWEDDDGAVLRTAARRCLAINICRGRVVGRSSITSTARRRLSSASLSLPMP